MISRDITIFTKLKCFYNLHLYTDIDKRLRYILIFISAINAKIIYIYKNHHTEFVQ